MRSIRHFNKSERTLKKEERRESPHRLPYTVVLEDCPTYEQIKEYAIQLLNLQDFKSNGLEVPLWAGVAKVHPDDDFNKKVGVTIASKKANLGPARHYKMDITTMGGEVYVEFVAVKPGAEIQSIALLYSGGSYPEISHCSIRRGRK